MKPNARVLLLCAAAIVVIAVAAVMGSRREQAMAAADPATVGAEDSHGGTRHNRALMYLLR